MTRTLITMTAVLAMATASYAGWINEFHYDNTSTDTGEFVEIVLPAGGNAGDYTVTLYNGNGGAEYESFTVDTFDVGDTVNGFTIYSLGLPSNGIQNGAPDGIALSNGGLIQFISYEGTFTASGGPADGVESTDIGVFESSSTPAGSSVGLTGATPDGTWAYFEAIAGPVETPGSLNPGQTFIPEPATMAMLGLGGLIALRRRSA